MTLNPVKSLCKQRFKVLQKYFDNINMEDLSSFEDGFFESQADKEDRALVHLFVVTVLKPLITGNLSSSRPKIKVLVEDGENTILVINCRKIIRSTFSTAVGGIRVQNLNLFDLDRKLLSFKGDVLMDFSKNDLVDADIPYIIEIGRGISTQNPHSTSRIVFNLSHNHFMCNENTLLQLLHLPCTKRVDITFNGTEFYCNRDFFQQLEYEDRSLVGKKLVFIPEFLPEWRKHIPKQLNAKYTEEIHESHWMFMDKIMG